MPRLSKIGAAALAAFGWTGLSSVSASYLVVAGGGSGGGTTSNTPAGGGGGAGGLLTGTTALNPLLSYTVTVGAGGAAGNAQGSSGSSSILSSITATGGGGGGTINAAGSSGGSGGGGSNNGAGGAGTSGQGNNGGTPTGALRQEGSGGGGAGAVGSGSNNTAVGGAGGNGSASSISGSSVTYAGGGGGGGGFNSGDAGGSAGSGGAGAGGNYNTAGSSASANTGSAGGGCGAFGSASTRSGGGGGSGIVIISYVGAQQFGGGVVTKSGGSTIHTFTTSGTLVPITPLSASALVVAGGGGGGDTRGGGGGAGGFRTGSSLTIDTNSIYLVTVGAGGAGSATTASRGSNGSDSTFLSITSTGGGGGGSANGTPSSAILSGATGGSGGGGAADSNTGATFGSGGAGNTPSTSPSQGNNGGASVGTTQFGGGGGGGAGAVGSTGLTSGGGAGGAGTTSSISGSSVTYAGGGGGGGQGAGGAGGSGGGGNGASGSSAGSNGTANTGGGGGGDGNPGVNGGTGGSGVVIISYAGATQLMAGGTVTITGGNVIHTFTSTGFLAPLKYVGNSLRFRSSASAYLNRTAGTPTNANIWTWSAWVKRGTLTTRNTIFSGGSTNVNYIGFGDSASTDNFGLSYANTPSQLVNVQSTAVYRDPAAWYHFMVVYDSTSATSTITGSSTDRVRLYVNGVQINSFTATTPPSQNTSVNINAASAVLNIGRRNVASPDSYLDGYLAEVNFIDGQALTPNSFGTINSYGVWQPITYGGSYGTNGFYLPFTNTTSTTTLGYDFSPNGNNWTTNNISLTAGTTYDSMTDVPTLTSATAANYSTFNPVNVSGGGTTTITDANLSTSVGSTTTFGKVLGSIGMSTGKWYWEVTVTAVGGAGNIGIGDGTAPSASSGLGGVAGEIAYQSSGNKYTNNSGTAYGATYTTNDIIGVAYDADAGSITFYKNNASQGAITGFSGTKFAAVGSGGGTNPQYAINFGQRPLTYTAPSGFVALNTFNL
jgi:hypothetical protein